MIKRVRTTMLRVFAAAEIELADSTEISEQGAGPFRGIPKRGNEARVTSTEFIQKKNIHG